MFAILLFTILGFLIGLLYVINKRKIRVGKTLSAIFLGFLALGTTKILRDYYKKHSKQGGGRWGY
jgi:hypothetical protein